MIVGVVLQHRARLVYTARACSDRWELVASEAETSWKIVSVTGKSPLALWMMVKSFSCS